jgi:HEPN domain-containing protein
MATRDELRALADLRLREAEALFAANLYDGCVYLCGYVVELALKAVICSTLRVDRYPDEQFFWTHKFKDLTLLAGLREQVSLANPEFLKNWSIATEWKPDWRYQPAGTYTESQAEVVLSALKADPHGVLPYLSQRW